MTATNFLWQERKGQGKEMGKKLWLSIALLTVAVIAKTSLAYCNSQSLPRRIVELAQAEIGKGETVSNNRGEDIKRYCRGKDGYSWCAGFVSYCLYSAGEKRLGYSLSAKEIWNRGRRLKWEVKEPRAGDLVVFWRKSKASWQAHIAIVSKVCGDKVKVIEGNRGVYPAKVREFEYQKDNVPRLFGYIRVKR